jgi:hypothetical protein
LALGTLVGWLGTAVAISENAPLEKR